MTYNGYEMVLLFFTYSFVGWIVETVICSLVGKRFRNRGFVSLPFCLMYGVMGVMITLVFGDMRQSVVLLFLGSSLLATLIQWLGGIYLEHLGGGKWWDYSRLPLNHLNGYVAIPVSAVFGGFGTLAVLFVNDLLVGFYRLLPRPLQGGIVLGLLISSGLDVLVSFLSFLRIGNHLPIRSWNNRLLQMGEKLAQAIAGYVRKRMEIAYPEAVRSQNGAQAVQEAQAENAVSNAREMRTGSTVSNVREGQAKIAASGAGKAETGKTHSAGSVETAAAESLGRRELFWLFLIGALLGDGVETIFMWLTRGVWMSRSSLVWGAFSVVWGLAMVIATLLLYKERFRSDGYIFIVGTLLGGTYEYLCSVFTQICFGAVFWDYSHLPFNVAGRVNLLYCFFWGIASVIWIKRLFPPLHRFLQKILHKERYLASVFLLLFMTANMVMSGAALVRYDHRSKGKGPYGKVSVYLDQIYDDEMMQKKYPGLKRR